MNQRQRAVDVRKASFLGIVVHVLQVLAMLALLAVAYVKHGQIGDSPVFRYLAIAATGIVIISSVISVGEALNARRIMTQMDGSPMSLTGNSSVICGSRKAYEEAKTILNR